MRLEKCLLLFVRGDLAVLDEMLLVAVRIQAIRELGFLSLASSRVRGREPTRLLLVFSALGTVARRR